MLVNEHKTKPSGSKGALRHPVGRILVVIAGLVMSYQGLMQPGMTQVQGGPSKEQLSAAADQALSKMSQFKDAEIAFKIDYPANWEVTKSAPPMVFNVQTYKGVVNVSVATEPVPPATSIDQYTQATEAGIASQDKQLNPVKISQENVRLGGGVPGCKVGYTVDIPSGGSTIKGQQLLVLSVKNGRGYVFTCTTLQDWYPVFGRVFEAMARTIDLSGK